MFCIHKFAREQIIITLTHHVIYLFIITKSTLLPLLSFISLCPSGKTFYIPYMGLYFAIMVQIQKPACPWEFYIYRQLDIRIPCEEVPASQKQQV